MITNSEASIPPLSVNECSVHPETIVQRPVSGSGKHRQRSLAISASEIACTPMIVGTNHSDILLPHSPLYSGADVSQLIVLIHRFHLESVVLAERLHATPDSGTDRAPDRP